MTSPWFPQSSCTAQHRGESGRRPFATWRVAPLVLLAACAFYPPERIPAFVPPAKRFVDSERVRSATVIVAGTITRVTREWRYEPRCGLIARLLRRCDDTRAYVATIHVDSTLAGPRKRRVHVAFYVRGDSAGLGDGTRALFLVRERMFPRADQCWQTGCQADRLYTLEDDLDVLPLEAWDHARRLRSDT